MTDNLEHRLPQVFGNLPIKVNQPIPNINIRGIVFDSREVQPGFLFVALKGENTDGHRFIPQAIERGAVAIVGSGTHQDLGVPYIQVLDTRLILAYLSAAYYNHPGRQLTVIGVTGTDGKTTTANLIYQILQKVGLRSGIISTVNATIGDQVLDTGLHVTTPEAPEVQEYLARMVGAGLTHVVIEVTSHGLVQERVTGCEFDVGVITNVTHEHLDYHGSFDAYLKAKGKLFSSLLETSTKPRGNLRVAVLNRDDISFDYLKQVSPNNQISYSLRTEASLTVSEVTEKPEGLSFIVNGLGKTFPVQTRLVGRFNVANCLAAIGVTYGALRLPVDAVKEGILAMQGVPGRMERIDLGQDFTAMVDFAHTPNALRQALVAIREITNSIKSQSLVKDTGGRVIAVFGSAGLRDKQKRWMMAQVSIELADITILTAEDPRTESLDDILAEMAKGAQSQGGVEGQSFYCIPDRGEAIRFGVNIAQPGDLVVACGKGHEQSMCFGEKEYPWDDRVAIRAALAERLRIAGPKMPYLPTQS